MMSKLITIIRTAILPALLIALIGATPSFGQSYKETFNEATEAAKAKNYTLAVQKFTEAAKGAKAEGDEAVERQARGVVAKIEYNLGRALHQREDYAKAMQHFTNGIEQDPTFAKNYLARAASMKKTADWDQAVLAYQQAMQVAEQNADSQTARAAETAIRDQYIYLASSTLSRGGNRATRNDATEAVEHLEMLQMYVEPDADTYYYLAEANKVLGNFEQAVALADQGLEIHRGSRTDKAKIYFVKGEALMNSGQTEAAKEAFQNALFGSYRASAEHYIETLGTN